MGSSVSSKVIFSELFVIPAILRSRVYLLRVLYGPLKRCVHGHKSKHRFRGQRNLKGSCRIQGGGCACVFLFERMCISALLWVKHALGQAALGFRAGRNKMNAEGGKGGFTSPSPRHSCFHRCWPAVAGPLLPVNRRSRSKWRPRR